ncbi:hypothetical protein PHYBOEH_003963 [Phytophthora boehmeriae]|uniref:Protein phosphatase 2C n=1 Tax=Phytophthora boehmeriae TaxID=109152 RepID=A0A8T1WPF5_9STRA|nr:hypothetical protein PHYBOEH_003963 [Phytophthora boehmeriae]
MAAPASHAHRERAETAPTSQLNAQAGAIPVPTSQQSRRSSSNFARRFFDRGGGRSSSSSSSSDAEDAEDADGTVTFGQERWTDIRDISSKLDAIYRYNGGKMAAFMEGYLEKQSSENPKLWKRRWFVMQDSKLFYYKAQSDVREQKPTDETCCGVISMENIDSVTTAKDFGVAAFQIRMESRRYVLRAESRDMMHEWLFNFQKSIANIVSALSRTQAEHRPNWLCNSLSRRQSMPRVNRSVSFDNQEQFPAASMDDFYRGRASAATFTNQRLVSYLCAHDAFMTDTRLAFEECFARIDEEFLTKAKEESLGDGTTAAVVLIRGNRLITSNIGDCRAVASIGGEALDIIEEQTPGRPDERERIEAQGGWVKEERELQLSKLHSMDLSDPEIQQRAERVVKWVTIYRVNGELAVSRAIGDIDYKGEALSKYEYWAFPEGHDREFHGDLVISVPEYQEIEITPEFDFLVLACDGLWDTIKSKEAVKYVSERLNEGYSAKQASQSLANLAIRSGSSDNVSVIVVLLNTEQVSTAIDAYFKK